MKVHIQIQILLNKTHMQIQQVHILTTFLNWHRIFSHYDINHRLTKTCSMIIHDTDHTHFVLKVPVIITNHTLVRVFTSTRESFSSIATTLVCPFSTLMCRGVRPNYMNKETCHSNTTYMYKRCCYNIHVVESVITCR